MRRGSERPFDAMVTDYMMPGLDGGELIRRAHLRLPDLPAVVVTGYAEFDGLQDLPSAVRVLHKPFGIGQLTEEVRAAVLRGTTTAPGTTASSVD